jgi:hypothetical protein
MCVIRRVFYEEVIYTGQEAILEPHYELQDGSVEMNVGEDDLDQYVLHLEEQLYLARELQEAREVSRIHAETFMKEAGLV